MRRSFLSGLVARDDARLTLTIESTSADSERQIIELRGPAVRSLAAGYDHTRRTRAWRKNPLCVECGVRIPSARVSGMLPVDGVDRVAHKKPCFLVAIAKANPTFSRRVAHNARSEANQ